MFLSVWVTPAYRRGPPRAAFRQSRCPGLLSCSPTGAFAPGLAVKNLPSGGAMSAYAEGDGNHRSEGESIIPMTRWDALNWCEAHRAQEAIDEYFGDMVGNA